MRGRYAGALLALLLAAAPALATASAPEASLRPEPRPDAEDSADPIVAVMSTSGVIRSPRPEARPEDLPETRAETPSAAGRETRPDGDGEPRIIRASAQRTFPLPEGLFGRRSTGLCGVSGLEGVKLAPIAARTQGCGIEEPVRITAVDGIPLSTPATVDCPTAVALRTWVQDALVPTVGRKGGGVARIDIFASYACRPRNNQRGARISEHGRGRAIDIGGITLANGDTITVLNGWRSEETGPMLRELHRAACGTFGTVLGPSSDRFHQNHFHFDTARYRSGSYCR